MRQRKSSCLIFNSRNDMDYSGEYIKSDPVQLGKAKDA